MTARRIDPLLWNLPIVDTTTGLPSPEFMRKWAQSHETIININSATRALSAFKGTVASVGLSLDSGLYTVSGSPVKSTGTLAGTLNTQNANYVFAGPSNGAAAKPTFRPLVPADIPGGSGFPALSLITEITTSGSQASVTFSSISASYRDLEVRVRGRSTAAATNVDYIHVQVNGDVGTTYDWELSWGTGVVTTMGNAQGTGDTSWTLSEIPAATSTANNAGVAVILFSDYRGTTFSKACISRGFNSRANSAGNKYALLGGGEWASTAAINAIKIYLQSGNFVDGSVVSLYGSY